ARGDRRVGPQRQPVRRGRSGGGAEPGAGDAGGEAAATARGDSRARARARRRGLDRRAARRPRPLLWTRAAQGLGFSAPMLCPSCGTDNREGRKFCAECGEPLASACPACGAANEPGERFCGECGSALDAAAPVAAVREERAAERRLVSILFADLVGFTPLSETRDAEEVRELLSRYFEACRRIIGLYGGTVEKFIGDAVMAVWGAPTATEDDAERAVRAALDLVAAVSALGEEIGETDLRARAGVLTGEAAVSVGAQGEGMVAGDLVNTASRIQASAEPGCVYVGEATRRTTEQTIVYEEAGSFELKG